jgi:hypothetical protein
MMIGNVFPQEQFELPTVFPTELQACERAVWTKIETSDAADRKAYLMRHFEPHSSRPPSLPRKP